MRVAVVDDCAEDRTALATLLAEYFRERSVTVFCEEFEDGAPFLKAAACQKFDLVFTDIYMTAVHGMETAQRLLELAPGTRVVFLTMSTDHAVESYEVRAAYYLVKPLSKPKLTQALDHILRELLIENAVLQVQVNHIEMPILLKNLIYVDCVHRHTCLHLQGKLLYVDDAVGDVLDRLSQDSRFLHCNRGVMVNMEWVATALEQDFQLKGGELIPIRQRERGRIKKMFLAFSLRQLRGEGTP